MIGIDIIECSRVETIANDKKKLSKIFTKNEIEYFEKFSVDRATHIAGTFAVKEAVAKALQVGFCEELSAIDIELLHRPNGAPYISPYNTKLNKLLNGRHIEVSISHTNLVATAICQII